MTVKLAASELTERRAHFGTLLEHGNAPYQHKKDNDMSYFATLSTHQGRQTIWGVEPERAISESGAAIGDGIVLVQQGQRNVTVKAKERDAEGRATGKRVLLDTERNQWEVISLDNARDYAARQGGHTERVHKVEHHAARQR
jgi:putative DNA primase/helicase